MCTQELIRCCKVEGEQKAKCILCEKAEVRRDTYIKWHAQVVLKHLLRIHDTSQVDIVAMANHMLDNHVHDVDPPQNAQVHKVDALKMALD